MKTDLVPIKVILTRKVTGGIDWPEFNQIDFEIRGCQPWSKFIDSKGVGWFYDKVDNLGTGADHGTACTLVPQDFADAAATIFPEKVTIINEEEFEDFYNNRAMIKMPTEYLDTDVLQGIVARKQLEDLREAPTPNAEIVAARVKCLDPSCQHHRGIRKNLKKRWCDAKVELNITVHPYYVKE